MLKGQIIYYILNFSRFFNFPLRWSFHICSLVPGMSSHVLATCKSQIWIQVWIHVCFTLPGLSWVDLSLRKGDLAASLQKFRNSACIQKVCLVLVWGFLPHFKHYSSNNESVCWIQWHPLCSLELSVSVWSTQNISIMHWQLTPDHFGSNVNKLLSLIRQGWLHV